MGAWFLRVRAPWKASKINPKSPKRASKRGSKIVPEAEPNPKCAPIGHRWEKEHKTSIQRNGHWHCEPLQETVRVTVQV